MAEKQYYWLKLEKDFFKSKEIKKLRKIAGGDTLTIIYLKMALYSLENEGVLIYEGIEEDLAAELSLELDEEVENIKLVLAFLQNNKMIETKGEDFYLNRIPEMTGKETGAAKRMRISRQRKEDNKQLVCNNVTEQLQDVTVSYTEKELDIDLEKDIEIDKRDKILIEIEKLNISEFLKEKFIEWYEYKKSIKDKLKTTISFTKMINQIGKDFIDEKHLCDSIDNSIMCNYKGVFPKEIKKQNTFDIKSKNKIATLEDMKGW